jgi:outer membrane protein TolC
VGWLARYQEENVRLKEDHYRAGISILSDLLDAQNLLQ